MICCKGSRTIHCSPIIVCLICFILSGAAYGNGIVALLSEGFENGISSSNWSVNEDRNTAGNRYYWGLKDECFKRTGTYSAFCCGAGGTSGYGRPCGNDYARDMDSWLISKPLNFTHLLGTLEFWYVNESESGLDFFRVYVIVGANNYLVWTAPSVTSDYPNIWQKVTIDLSHVPGLGTVTDLDTVQIGFGFSSDYSVSERGTYLDDILVSGSPSTGIAFIYEAPLPKDFSMAQNFPNPFNPETNIEFQLETASSIQLGIFDVLGREIARLADGYFEAGSYRTKWNGTDAGGKRVASGIYFYTLKSSNLAITRKMVLLK